MKKRGFQIIIIFCLIFSLVNMAAQPISADTTSFSDVMDTDWYTENIAVLVEEGIIAGFPNGTFRPGDYMTVDQFIKTMVVALGYNLPNGESYWAQTYLNKARELALIDFNEFSTQASAEKIISRVQMTKICERTLKVLEGEKTYTQTAYIKNIATDSLSIDATGFSEYVYHMWEAGIITGYPDGSFKPYEPLSRSEAVTVIRRIIDGGERKLIVEDDQPNIMAEQAIYENMIALKNQYPEGMTWTNDNYYAWQGGIYSGGYGCMGFAFLLSDAGFGSLEARKHTDFNNLRVGDILRINDDTHSVIILSIHETSIIIAEGNYNSSIHWGRTLSMEEVKSEGDYVLTRYN